MDLKELQVGSSDLRQSLRISLHKDFSVPDNIYTYIVDVFIDHPELGNSAIIRYDGLLYAVPYIENKVGRIRLDTVAVWKEVRTQYKIIDEDVDEDVEEINESSIVTIDEDNADSPLILKTRLIKTGFGNKKRNHYYSKKLLTEHAHMFVGTKMYLTNHKTYEVNTRNEVAVVMEASYDNEQNGIVAKVGVFDEAFAQNIRNRSSLGVLESLHCSISAVGMAYKEPISIGDRTGRSIKEFTSINSVDWVSNAGAGGNALEIMS